MAAVLTGTPVAINWAAGIDPAAQNITIPSDATAVYMMWAYDGVDANGHGLASVTLNGAAPDQTFEIPTAAGFFPASGVAAWYNPATGSQALNPAWDIAPVEGPVTIVAFVKDGDTTAWRDADADQDIDANAVSVTLTTVAGDLVIKFDQRFDGSENPPSLTSGWTNGATGGNVDEGCRLSYISASGTTQVCASEDESYSTVVAISIPAGSATSSAALSVNSTATLTGAGASVVSAAASIGATATVTMTGSTVSDSADWSVASTAALTGAGASIVSAAASIASVATVTMTDGSVVVEPARNYDNGVPAAWYADVGWSALYGHQQQGIPLANRNSAVTVVSAAASITSTATLQAVGASTNAGAVDVDAVSSVAMAGAANVAAALGIESEIVVEWSSESSTSASRVDGVPIRRGDYDTDMLMDLAQSIAPLLHQLTGA